MLGMRAYRGGGGSILYNLTKFSFPKITKKQPLLNGLLSYK